MSSDALIAIEARLANFEANGITNNPKTTNPAPTGLISFSISTAMLCSIYGGLVEADAVGIASCMAIFFGLAQVIVAIQEYSRGNIFGMTVFGVFGPFWLFVGLLNILAAAGLFKAPPKGMACMCTLFGIVAFIFWLTTFSLNVVISLLLLVLSILFFLLAAGQTHPDVLKAGGKFGIFVAALAMYGAAAGILGEMYGRSILPVFPLAPINRIATGRLGGFGTKKIVTDVEAADKD